MLPFPYIDTIPTRARYVLTKIQHLYGYLNKYTSVSIKFNSKIPDYDNFKTIEEKWVNLYAGYPEGLPKSCLSPMGKPVLIYSFVDSNLMSNMTMVRFQNGAIHLLNNTPI